MHSAIGGLSGGLQGAAGAAISSNLLPVIGERFAKLNLPEGVREALTIAVATALGSAGQAPGAAAAFNQAANNYVSHSPFPGVRRMLAQENARLLNECGENCTQEDFRRIDQQVAKLEVAANLAAISKKNTLTQNQAEQLSQVMLELVPIYGSIESAAQLITGKTSVTGEEVSRLLAAIGIIPAGAILKKQAEITEKSIEKTIDVITNKVKATRKTEGASRLSIQENNNWKSFIKNDKEIKIGKINPKKVEAVIKETLSGSNNFTSSMLLTSDEALSAGQKYLGTNYREVGKPGSGVFHSADGTREFRIYLGSLEGTHQPGIPHVHFAVKDLASGKYISNNHVPYIE